MRSAARPWWVGNHVLVAEDILHRIAEAIEAAAARVALVALHDRGPLMGGHGPGARVGKQVDQHIVGRQAETGCSARPRSSSSRSTRVVQRIGSTLLMRNGSMIVLTGMKRL